MSLTHVPLEPAQRAEEQNDSLRKPLADDTIPDGGSATARAAAAADTAGDEEMPLTAAHPTVGPRATAAAVGVGDGAGGEEDEEEEDAVVIDAERDSISIAVAIRTRAEGSGSISGGGGSDLERVYFPPEGVMPPGTDEASLPGVVASETRLKQTTEPATVVASVDDRCARERALSKGNAAKVRPLKALDDRRGRNGCGPSDDSKSTASAADATFVSSETTAVISSLGDQPELDQAVLDETDTTLLRLSGIMTVRGDVPTGGYGSGDKDEMATTALGLRGVPGPHLGAFFRGTALDAKAARKEDGGGSGGGRGSSSSNGGGRVAAISAGLRRIRARTKEEAAAVENMALRLSDGTASHEVLSSCRLSMCLYV